MYKTPMPNIVRYLSASYSPSLETDWGLVSDPSSMRAHSLHARRGERQHPFKDL